MDLSKFFKLIKYFFTGIIRADRIEKLYKKQRYLECCSMCTKIISTHQTDFFAHYYLGLSNSKLNFIDDSTQNLRDALAHENNSNPEKSFSEYSNYARFQLAMNFRKQRNYKQAIEEIEIGIKAAPNYVHFYILKSDILQDKDELNEAIDSINRGLLIVPKDTDLLKAKDLLVYSHSVAQSEKRNRA